jgi:hypothetical protein
MLSSFHPGPGPGGHVVAGYQETAEQRTITKTRFRETVVMD